MSLLLSLALRLDCGDLTSKPFSVGHPPLKLLQTVSWVEAAIKWQHSSTYWGLPPAEKNNQSREQKRQLRVAFSDEEFTRGFKSLRESSWFGVVHQILRKASNYWLETWCNIWFYVGNMKSSQSDRRTNTWKCINLNDTFIFHFLVLIINVTLFFFFPKTKISGNEYFHIYVICPLNR